MHCQPRPIILNYKRYTHYKIAPQPALRFIAIIAFLPLLRHSIAVTLWYVGALGAAWMFELVVPAMTRLSGPTAGPLAIARRSHLPIGVAPPPLAHAHFGAPHQPTFPGVHWWPLWHFFPFPPSPPLPTTQGLRLSSWPQFWVLPQPASSSHLLSALLFLSFADSLTFYPHFAS